MRFDVSHFKMQDIENCDKLAVLLQDLVIMNIKI